MPNGTTDRVALVQKYIADARAKGYADGQIREALVKSGVDGNTITSLMGATVAKKKPFYKQWWFYVPAGLVVIFLGLLVAFIISEQLVPVEEEVVVEEDEREERVVVPLEEEEVVTAVGAECTDDAGCQSVYGDDYVCSSGYCYDESGAEAICGDGRCDIGEGGAEVCPEDCPCEEDDDCGDDYYCNSDGECIAYSYSSGGGTSGSSSGSADSSEEAAAEAECDDDFDCDEGYSCESSSCAATACNDASDNDGDSMTDLDDEGCASLDDSSEEFACSNFADDEGDGMYDFFGGCDTGADGDTDYVCGCDLDADSVLDDGEFFNATACDTAYAYGCDLDPTDEDWSYSTDYTCSESGETYYEVDTDCLASDSEAEGGCTSDDECRSGYVCTINGACGEDDDSDGIADVNEVACLDGEDNDEDGFIDYLGGCDTGGDSVNDVNCLGEGLWTPRLCRNYCEDTLTGDYLRPDLDCVRLVDRSEEYACLDGYDNDRDGEWDYLGGCDTDGDLISDANCLDEGITRPGRCYTYCTSNLTGTYLDPDTACSRIWGRSERLEESDCEDYADGDSDGTVDSTGGCDLDGDGDIEYTCGCYDPDTNVFSSYLYCSSVDSGECATNNCTVTDDPSTTELYGCYNVVTDTIETNTCPGLATPSEYSSVYQYLEADADCLVEDCVTSGDEEGDGFEDCADDDCYGETGPSGETCEYGTETECDDGYDNDGDGDSDDVDTDCGAAEETDACAADVVLPTCADGVDNDLDGTIDYRDGAGDTDSCDSWGSDGEEYTEAAVETACDDSADDDGDGLTDCADSDCANSTGIYGEACEPSGETICDDGYDNDGDSYSDTADDDCTEAEAEEEAPYVGTTLCDDDGDCAPGEVCSSFVCYTPECGDGVDNDGDGYTDYPDDTDCDSATDDAEGAEATLAYAPEVQEEGFFARLWSGFLRLLGVAS